MTRGENPIKEFIDGLKEQSERKTRSALREYRVQTGHISDTAYSADFQSWLALRGDRETLFLANTALAVSKASAFNSSVKDCTTITFDELLQESLTALKNAAEHYNPAMNYIDTKGNEAVVKFSTYALPWIEGALKDCRRRALGLRKGALTDLYKVNKIKEALPDEGCTRDDLIEALSATFDEKWSIARLDAVAQTERWLHIESIDRPLGVAGTEGDECLADTLKDVDSGFDRVDRQVSNKDVEGLLNTLRNEKAREAVKMRYGLNGSEPATYKDIAMALDLSESQAAAMCTQSIAWLSDPCRLDRFGISRDLIC